MSNIDSVYGYLNLSARIGEFFNVFYQTVHQHLTRPYTLSPIGPTVGTFAYRESVTPNSTPNRYSVSCIFQNVVYKDISRFNSVFNLDVSGNYDIVRVDCFRAIA